ncbi:unnamed protein product [Dibothriocephalus latus]|uniref:Uncharacterized protein n=1 Tax=Dibothriocephalus latus TaxID=60516 RepID=A0A3P7LSR6_DIBLA|nr:unnamed protein product [Dibothriocephalus latus]
MQQQLEQVLLKWARQQLDLGPTEGACLLDPDHGDGNDDADEDDHSSLEEEEEEEEEEPDSDDTPHSLCVGVKDANVARSNAGAAVLSCILAFRQLYNHPSLLHSFLRKHFCQKSAGARKSIRSDLLEELLDKWKSSPSSLNPLSCSELSLTSGKLIVLQHLLRNLLSLSTGSGGKPHRIVLVSNFIQASVVQ